MTNNKKIEQEELGPDIYEALVDAVLETAIFSVTDEKGNIIFANRKFLEISKYPLEELIGQNHRILKSGHQPQSVFTDLWATISNGKIWNGEIKNRAKDGTYYWVNATIVPILDENGRPKKYVALRIIITERKDAEEKLRLSQEGFDEAQRVSHTGVWGLDLITNKLSWSKECYKIFEIDSEKFGATYEAFVNLVHPEDRDMVNTAYTESVKNRAPYNIEHRLLMSDGRIKYVNERCETIYDSDGKPVRSVGTIYDITERKEMQEKDRKHIENLEKMNKYTVDRELRMIELKKEIKILEDELSKVRAVKSE